MRDWFDGEAAKRILESYRTFAVVGCSPSPARPSHGVTRFLRDRGYRVLPVNPSFDRWEDLPCYPDLAAIPDTEALQVVQLFRRSELVAAHVDEAIAAGARAIWMQLGVIDERAAARAEAAGLDVVMNRCPAIEYPRWFGVDEHGPPGSG